MVPPEKNSRMVTRECVAVCCSVLQYLKMLDSGHAGAREQRRVLQGVAA